MTLSFVLCCVLAVPVGDVVEFNGTDVGANIGDPIPNSDAAAALFGAAAGALGTPEKIDFESLALGSFTSLEIAPGVTATLTGMAIEAGVVPDFWFGGFDRSVLGYNTTTAGNQFLGIVPIFNIGTVTVTLEFDPPVQAFGSYLTGYQSVNSDLAVSFDDAVSQQSSIQGTILGGAHFWGFTDPGASIPEITFTVTNVLGTREIFGMDDMCFVRSPSECFLVIGDAPGTASFLEIEHLFQTQVGPTIEDSFPVLLTSIPEFVLPSAPKAVRSPAPSGGSGLGGFGLGGAGLGRAAPDTGDVPAWMLDGTFAVQVLMWNPVVFPGQPEQCTAGLLVTIGPDGTVSTTPYGASVGGLELTAEFDTNADGESVIRFPFTIPGLDN